MELAGEEFNWKEGLNDGINCGNRPKKWEMWEKFKKKNKTLWSESEEEREKCDKFLTWPNDQEEKVWKRNMFTWTCWISSSYETSRWIFFFSPVSSSTF